MEYDWLPMKFNNAAWFLCHCVIVSKYFTCNGSTYIYAGTRNSFAPQRFTQAILSSDTNSFEDSSGMILASQAQIF